MSNILQTTQPTSLACACEYVVSGFSTVACSRVARTGCRENRLEFSLTDGRLLPTFGPLKNVLSLISFLFLDCTTPDTARLHCTPELPAVKVAMAPETARRLSSRLYRKR